MEILIIRTLIASLFLFSSSLAYTATVQPCKYMLIFNIVTITMNDQGEAWPQAAPGQKKFKTLTDATAFIKNMDIYMGIRNRDTYLKNTQGNSWSWELSNLGIMQSSSGFVTSELFTCK